MTRWMSFLAVMLWGVVLSSAEAQEVPFTGVVVDQAVPIRAGAGNSFYVVGEATAGSEARVEEVVFGWYKIVPPQGIYSYVSRAFVDADGAGKVGKINIGRAAVRAASVKGAVDSYRRQIDLIKGDMVEIVGEESSFYKIVPPKGAYVFLPPGSVRVSMDGGVQSPVSVPEQTVSPPSDSGTLPVAAVRSEAQTAGEGVTVDSAAVAEPEAGEGAITEQRDTRVTLAPVSEALKQVEKELIESQRLPLEQQPTSDLLNRYNLLAQQKDLGIVDKHIISLRITQLKRNTAIAQTLREIDSAREANAADQIKAVAAEVSSRKGPDSPYVVRGGFTASGVYNGKTMPRLYRIADPTNDRTIAYVKLQPGTSPSPYVGRYVGIVGKSKFDPSVGLDVIEVERIDLIAASAAR